MKTQESVMTKKVEGRKGGSSRSRKPIVDQNSILTNSQVGMTFALGTGPMLGFSQDIDTQGNSYTRKNVQNNIFFNETPLSQRDGAVNFPGIDIQSRLGYPTQTMLKGVTQTQRHRQVGEAITHIHTPVYTVQDLRVDSLIFVIQLQALMRSTSQGDRRATFVEFDVYLRQDEGRWFRQRRIKITGKTLSPQELDYAVRKPLGVRNSWAVKLVRVTPESKEELLLNDLYLSRWTEVEEERFSYPSIAIAHLSFQTQDWGALPSVSFRVKGRLVKIPSNYNPVTRVYKGIWTGQLKTSWTDNPAWVALDLLSAPQEEGGLNLPLHRIDLGALYEIARYCDEEISDGKGGKEPRYTANGVIDRAQSPYHLLQQIAGIWQGAFFMGPNGATFTIDKPSDPVILVTPSNVLEGKFTWSRPSLRSRHSIVKVRWNDPADHYRPAVEVVEDPALIQKIGVREIQLDACLCTRQSQALRLARWLLYTEEYETELVSYQASLDHIIASGQAVLPGQIIAVQDPFRLAGTQGGRFACVEGNQLELDRSVQLEGALYRLWYMGEDGQRHEARIKEQRGSFKRVTALTLPVRPVPYGVWVLVSEQSFPKLMRVVSVQEEEGQLVSVSAVAHNAEKYRHIENSVPLRLPSRAPQHSTGPLPMVKGFVATEGLVKKEGRVFGQLTLSWSKPQDNRVAGYEVEVLKPKETSWQPYTVWTEELILDDVNDGPWAFRLRAKAFLKGQVGPWSLEKKDLLFFKKPPASVSSFEVERLGDQLCFEWSPVQDLDLKGYEIRFSPLETALWEEAQTVATPKLGTETASFPVHNGVWLIKACDHSGYRSQMARKVVVRGEKILGVKIIETLDERASGFGGKKDHLSLSQKQGRRLLSLSGDLLVADWPLLEEKSPLVKGYALEGIYFCEKGFDFGAVYSCSLRAYLDVSGTALRVNSLKEWSSLAQMRHLSLKQEVDWSVRPEVRFRSQKQNEWSAWKKLSSQMYRGRYFEFRVVLRTASLEVTPFLRDLRITADMPSRLTGERNLIVPKGGRRIEYDKGFWTAPVLSVTPENMKENESFKVSEQTEKGFFIQFMDAQKEGVSGQIDFLAKGYGESL